MMLAGSQCARRAGLHLAPCGPSLSTPHVNRATTGSASEVFRYFLRLGVIAFGGPAAHIAIMRRELAGSRRWVSDQELIDMLGVTNLIPGPNSTEMTMHLGAKRAGFAGLWIGGFAFILPALVITTALAWAYVEYGTTAAGEGIILGVQPFMLAIIVQAIWGLRGAALKGVEQAYVDAALDICQGNVSQAAKLLGISRSTLYTRLEASGRSGARLAAADSGEPGSQSAAPSPP